MESKPPIESIIKREPVSVEYIPYGGQDKIKLSVSIVQNLIAVKTKSGKTCSERDAIRFIAMTQARRMNPFEGDCFLIGYDGRDGIPNFALVTAHQTYLKRAELHPEFDGMRSGVIVRNADDSKLIDLEGDFHEEGQQVVGGWATVFFKNRKQPMNKRLNLSRFQKPFGVWQDDPGGMICKCAEADALRSAFPTMLGGLYLREEIEIEPRKPEFSKPIFNGSQPPAVTDGGSPEPESGHAPEPEPPPPGPAPDPASQSPPPANGHSGGFNPLKAFRGLLKIERIKEGSVLDYLSTTGATDGSAGSLEEIQISNPQLIAYLAEKWTEFLEKYRAAEKGGAK